jgi:hypothetical protein
MIKSQPSIIKNAKGEIISLEKREQACADYWQREVNARFANALGYEINITTLTTIVKEISEQKFFEIAPADYLPMRVGNGAWSSSLQTYRSFMIGDQFETGIIDVGGQNSRLAVADAAVDSVQVAVFNWAKTVGWSIFDLELAAKSGNWDLVAAKEESRKKNWDLGIQRVAFLGARGDNSTGGSCLGLLNQGSQVTVNTAVITKAIKSMSTAELKTFTAALIEAFRSNCARTAWPTTFAIPESDYNGLASQASDTFPIKSTLELLEEAFKLITRNKSFKILPLAYGDSTYSGLGVQKYVLYNADPKSLVMNVPVDYTNTLANSIDNFSFQNVGYGQFTGVNVIRPLEMMYFQY